MLQDHVLELRLVVPLLSKENEVTEHELQPHDASDGGGGGDLVRAEPLEATGLPDRRGRTSVHRLPNLACGLGRFRLGDRGAARL